MERITRKGRRRGIPKLAPLIQILTLYSSAERTCAFNIGPFGRLKSSRRIIVPPKAESVGLLEYGDDNGDPNDPSAGWLRWMYTGSPRNTAEVALREPEALGGIPRSDRYSSR